MKRILLTLGILIICAVLPYLPFINAPFVYDDHGQIEENAFLRNSDNLSDILQLRTLGDTTILNGRRPLTLLSHYIDWHCWSGKPYGFRMTNLILHALCSAMVYLLLLCLAQQSARKDTGYNLFSFIGGLLFALHPVLSECVHSPAFRGDILFTLFALGYLLAGVNLHRHATIRSRAVIMFTGMGIFLAASLCAKESGIVVPLLLVVVWLCFPALRPSRLHVLWITGLSLLIIYYFAVQWSTGQSFQAFARPWNGLSLRYPENLFTLPWLWACYLGILIVPYPLILDRVLTPVTGWTDPRFITGTGILVVTAVIIISSISRINRKHTPWPGTALLWIVIMFLPVANIWPLFNPMAERYMYGMAVGFAMLCAWILAWPCLGHKPWCVLRKAVLAIVLTAYVMILIFRLSEWQHEQLLWRFTLQDEPKSARAHIWLGLEMQKQQRFSTAMAHFSRADKLNPQNVAALINKGILFGRTGDIEAAEQCMREAVSRRPDKAAAHWNLAVTLQLQGHTTDAAESIRKTLQLDPRHVPALKAMIVIHVDNGNYSQADDYCKRLLAIDPESPEAQAASSFLETRAVTDS